MAYSYREKRSIEASLVDQITELVAEDWEGTRVEKDFAEAYKGTLPCIVIGVLEKQSIKKEVGSKTHIKYYIVNFRIFATNDGNRLDMSDWLFDQIEDDFNYYTYDDPKEKKEGTLAGRIVVDNILDDRKELANTENLVQADKYRHLIQVKCHISLS
jgi:hypothetical protein